jgi:hypothetical protein
VTRRKPDGHEMLVFKAGAGDVLGEKSIATATPAMATVTTEAPSVMLCLPREAYASSLPSRMQPRVAKTRYASQISSTGFETLSELSVVAVVGSGAFARVALARHRGDGQVYALKKIERAMVGEGHVSDLCHPTHNHPFPFHVSALAGSRITTLGPSAHLPPCPLLSPRGRCVSRSSTSDS